MKYIKIISAKQVFNNIVATVEIEGSHYSHMVGGISVGLPVPESEADIEYYKAIDAGGLVIEACTEVIQPSSVFSFAKFLTNNIASQEEIDLMLVSNAILATKANPTTDEVVDLNRIAKTLADLARISQNANKLAKLEKIPKDFTDDKYWV